MRFFNEEFDFIPKTIEIYLKIDQKVKKSISFYG